MDCIFCKIAQGQIPAKKLAESKDVIAIADINPQATVHALIIPKRHVVGLNDMSASDRREILPSLYDLVDQIAREKNLSDDGYRTVFNTGANAGQTVFHLHLHLLGGSILTSRFGT